MKCMDIKEIKNGLSSSERKELFKTYVVEVRKLWEFVDKMEIEDKEVTGWTRGRKTSLLFYYPSITFLRIRTTPLSAWMKW
jgi:hypothetical protein